MKIAKTWLKLKNLKVKMKYMRSENASKEINMEYSLKIKDWN